MSSLKVFFVVTTKCWVYRAERQRRCGGWVRGVDVQHGSVPYSTTCVVGVVKFK